MEYVLGLVIAVFSWIIGALMVLMDDTIVRVEKTDKGPTIQYKGVVYLLSNAKPYKRGTE